MGEVGGMVVRKVGAIRMMVFQKQHFVLVNAKNYSNLIVLDDFYEIVRWKYLTT